MAICELPNSAFEARVAEISCPEPESVSIVKLRPRNWHTIIPPTQEVTGSNPVARMHPPGLAYGSASDITVRADTVFDKRPTKIRGRWKPKQSRKRHQRRHVPVAGCLRTSGRVKDIRTKAKPIAARVARKGPGAPASPSRKPVSHVRGRRRRRLSLDQANNAQERPRRKAN